MVLAQLIKRFRSAAFDLEEPYLFSDAEITDWLNEGLDEAAVRSRLIHESVDPDVCHIVVLPGVSVYPLHESLHEVDCLHLFDEMISSQAEELIQIAQDDLTNVCHDWRTRTGQPRYVIVNDTSIRLSPTPTTGALIKLEGYRRPLQPMVVDTDKPEINTVHHETLIEWVKYKGFGRPDSEVFDPTKSATAETIFTNYFGIKPKANYLKRNRVDYPYVKPCDL